MTGRRSNGTLDLHEVHRTDYTASLTPKLLRIGPATYLGISGLSRPGDATFQERVGALYGMAYTIKFQEKAIGRDFRVAMLEGIYSTPNGRAGAFATGRPLRWTLLVRVPDHLRATDLRAARARLRSNGKAGPFDDVRVVKLSEGRCVQRLHVGSYASERRTIDSMRTFAAANGVVVRGPHHEIYLSDPRRVPAVRLRTILRYPVGRPTRSVRARARSPTRARSA